MAQKRNMSSVMKPDYFIAYNGLPNIIISSRHVIRKPITTTISPPMSSRYRINNQQKNIYPLTHDISSNSKNQKNRQNLFEMHFDSNKRTCMKKSEKDIINNQSKASLNKLQSRLNNEIISSSSSSSSSIKIEATDNKSNENIKRRPKAIVDDNKFTHQRKYDNTIFRHDLPDRIVLPPLPI